MHFKPSIQQINNVKESNSTFNLHAARTRKKTLEEAKYNYIIT